MIGANQILAGILCRVLPAAFFFLGLGLWGLSSFPMEQAYTPWVLAALWSATVLSAGLAMGVHLALRFLNSLSGSIEPTRDATGEQCLRKESIERSFRGEMADFSAIILHSIGNSITPARAYMDFLDLRKLDQMAEYLQKSFGELKDHHDDLQYFIEVDERGKAVWAYLNRLVDSLREHTMHGMGIKGRIEGAVESVVRTLGIQKYLAEDDEEDEQLGDLNGVIGAVAQMMEGSLSSRGIDLVCDLHPNLPGALIKPTCLLLILARLIQSSYRVLERTAVKGKRVIQIETGYGSGRVKVEIRDNRMPCRGDEASIGSESPLEWLSPAEQCRYSSFLKPMGGTMSFTHGPQGQGMTACLTFDALGPG